MNKIFVKDGKEYVKINCPHCGAELLFSREPRNRRVHAMCKTCEKELEVLIK